MALLAAVLLMMTMAHAEGSRSDGACCSGMRCEAAVTCHDACLREQLAVLVRREYDMALEIACSMRRSGGADEVLKMGRLRASIHAVEVLDEACGMEERAELYARLYEEIEGCMKGMQIGMPAVREAAALQEDLKELGQQLFGLE